MDYHICNLKYKAYKEYFIPFFLIPFNGKSSVAVIDTHSKVANCLIGSFFSDFDFSN